MTKVNLRNDMTPFKYHWHCANSSLVIHVIIIYRSVVWFDGCHVTPSCEVAGPYKNI